MASKKVVFMFSGQGSQYYQMGKQLYHEYGVFRRWLDHFNEFAIKFSGISILAEWFANDKKISDSFDRTIYTHPAIFMFQLALSKLLQSFTIHPDEVIGSSLGEFVAAAATGTCDEDMAFEMVLRQAHCLESKCAQGGMMAVISNEQDAFDPVIRYNSELVSLNGNHFVISGDRRGLAEIERKLKQRNISCQMLPVSYGFHSKHIDEAASDYLAYLRTLDFTFPRVDFISGCEGGRKKRFERDYFWRVVRDPILFPDAIRNLEQEGEHLYLDLSPSGTLVNVVKQCLSSLSRSECIAVWTPYHRIESFPEQLDSLSFKLSQFK